MVVKCKLSYALWYNRVIDERAPCHYCRNIGGDGCRRNFGGGCILSGVVRLNFAFYTEVQSE